VLATTAAAVGASDDYQYDYDEEDLPRFERAELGGRIAEPEEEDEDADQVVLAAAGGPAARVDAADSWERNTGDPSLPYFLVEDGVPAAAEPVPTLEELRQTIPEEKHSTSVARTLAEIPILLIVAALIAFLVKTFLAQAYYIPSGSMLPQLQIDDRVVVSKLAYKAHDPRRGDIIVFDDPRTGVADAKADTGILRKIGEGIGIVQPSTDEFIKRVIGLPGDTVSGHDGHVFINGHELIEPYLPEGVATTDFPAVKVTKGRLWVMGDNRSGSADSRVFGQVKIDTIVGRAMVKVWPFDHISFL
jgi:signal peptidase I